MFIDLRERETETETDWCVCMREKDIDVGGGDTDVTEKYQCTPGIERATFGYMGQCSNQLSHPAKATLDCIQSTQSTQDR